MFQSCDQSAVRSIKFQFLASKRPFVIGYISNEEVFKSQPFHMSHYRCAWLSRNNLFLNFIASKFLCLCSHLSVFKYHFAKLFSIHHPVHNIYPTHRYSLKKVNRRLFILKLQFMDVLPSFSFPESSNLHFLPLLWLCILHHGLSPTNKVKQIFVLFSLKILKFLPSFPDTLHRENDHDHTAQFSWHP